MLLFILILAYFCTVPNWDYTTSVTNLLTSDTKTYQIDGRKYWYEADDTLSNNKTDLWEYCYDYGVIEEYHTGLFGYNFKRWFYKYNKETGFYDHIDEPEELKHYAGFAIG